MSLSGELIRRNISRVGIKNLNAARATTRQKGALYRAVRTSCRGIADALAGRLGSAFVPWRMDPDTYLRTIEARPAARRIDPGLFAPDVERRFGELVDLVRDRGAAFQEGWIDGLVEDVRAGAPDGDPDDPRS